MHTAIQRVAALSPEAFASLAKKRSPFPCAPGYGRNKSFTLAEQPTSREASMRPLARFYAGCAALFLGQHGRVFIAGPAPANPPKRNSVLKVLQMYSFCGTEKWKSRLRARAFHPPFVNRGFQARFV